MEGRKDGGVEGREGGGLRVLVAFSSPLNERPLDVEAERKAIATALSDGDHALEADFLLWVTAENLQTALGRGYDVLHLSGHGTEIGTLILEKPSGESHHLSADEVVKLLPAAPDRRPQLVILAMCHSEKAGQALHCAGVPYVVAIEREYPIYDRAATAYARGFYAALARGDSLSQAHENGCRAAALEPYSGDGATIWEGLPSSQRFCFLGDGQTSLVDEALSGRPQVNLPQLPDPRPVPVPPLVGRARDLITVSEMLTHLHPSRDTNRLVTVHGTGGVGKTVLAQALARFWWERARFADGVRSVSFENAENGRQAMETLLRAFDLIVEPRPGEDEDQARLRALVACLAGREMLLVLDNCETVADDLLGRLIRELLAHCPRLKLLATARRPLGLGGALERTHELEPLSEQHAAELFCRRAEDEGVHLYPDFRVADICQEVDCIPLAVELVAAHTRAYSLEDILADLRETALRLPAADLIGVPERHKGLRLSFDYTYQRLSSNGQRLFCAMSCFRGGAGLAAVRAVGGEWAAALEELVNWSLVRRQDGRYAMLPTVEEYAAQRLAADAAELGIDVKALRRRHAEYYLAYAQEHSGDYKAIEAELDNIRLGWAHVVADDTRDDKMVRSYTGAVQGYLKIRGHWDELMQWLAECGRACENLGDQAGLAATYNNIGQVHYARGDYAAALAWYEKSVAITEKLGDLAGLAATYNNIAGIHYARGDYAAALEWYEKSVAIKEKLGDQAVLATTYNNIGLIHKARGDYDAALEWYEKSVAINEQLGNQAVLATTYNNIAGIHYARGDYDAALEWIQRSLDIFERLGARASAATVRKNIEVLKQAMGRQS
ncbi:MAG: tetratricopeptide repeat protein [Anaerolineae bacterium]|nr:tetratricopeptide repeat protein [Anaerolineae bacterium]